VVVVAVTCTTWREVDEMDAVEEVRLNEAIEDRSWQEAPA
jgi:hypothetical protein